MSETFTFTSRSGKQRVLERHKTYFDVLVTDASMVRFSLHLEGQEAGMTLDDRGVQGWDSPVLVDVSVEFPAPDGIRFADLRGTANAPVEQAEKFVYYWDHSTVTALSATIEGRAAQAAMVALDVDSGEGAVRFVGELVLTGLRVQPAADGDPDLAAARAKALLGLDTLPDWKTGANGLPQLYLKL